MSLRENLTELGWHLSQEGFDTISENGQIQDLNILNKRALDYDLRDTGDAAFPEDFTKDPSKLEKPIIVQIQKIRNVSAPKANEESTSAPRMLKLTLHDGKTVCTGLETSPISSLSINTPPGTKVLIKNEDLEVCHGIISLTPSVIKVLGGKVTHMIEKWELNRSLAKHTRALTSSGGIGLDGGPPPWIPFGQRLDPQSVDKQFKSLQDAAKQENADFEAQRKGAIAEAQRLSGVKKVFGGGTKPLLDANVQKIVDAGFSEEQAENTLKYTKNNVDRALKILHKQDNPDKGKDKPKEADPPKRKGRNKDLDEDGAPVKPSGKVSLFDFLEDKLPNVPEKDKHNHRQNNPGDERPADRERGHNTRERDRNGQKGGSRSQGARYDNGRPRNDRHHNDTYHRDDRKYQTNEKPPRFQKKLDERNKQQQMQPNNVNVNVNAYNNTNTYQSAPHSYNRMQPDRSEKPQQYRNNCMDSLVDSTSALSLQTQGRSEERGYQPAYPSADGAPFRRAGDPKYPEGSYRRPQQVPPNGYMDQQNVYAGVGYGYGGVGGGARAYGGVGGAGGAGGYGRFLAGGLLGFQNAAVNEQARAVLGNVDPAWRVGDRCLALYWEDNNFYEAEITGISQNTVVVKFCAYGNHEEILKSNCLPFPAQGGSGGYMQRAGGGVGGVGAGGVGGVGGVGGAFRRP